MGCLKTSKKISPSLSQSLCVNGPFGDRVQHDQGDGSKCIPHFFVCHLFRNMINDRSFEIMPGCQDPILSYFFGKILFCPTFWEMSYFILFLAIWPSILVFYGLFITIISDESNS